jgi:hypothetical protein
MWIVAIYASEIDVGVVFIEIAFIGAFETSAHLKSFGMTGHDERVISCLARHVNCENGIQVHAWSEICEFFPGF